MVMTDRRRQTGAVQKTVNWTRLSATGSWNYIRRPIDIFQERSLYAVNLVHPLWRIRES